MNGSRLAVKVGLFVLIGILLLVLLLLSFSKGLSILTPTYHLFLKAKSVGGLKTRAAVLVSGVSVGNVVSSDVDADGRGVTIELAIRHKYTLRTDARFVIEQFGFLGDQFVAVYPQSTNAPVLAPGSQVVCEEPFNLQEVVRSGTSLIEKVDETVKRLNAALVRVDQTILHEKTLTNATVTVANFRVVSDKLVTMVDGVNRLVDTNSPPISLSVSNLVRFSEDLNQVTAELRQTFSTNRVELTSVIRNMESASRGLNNIVRDVESGRGIAGSLLKDDQLQSRLTEIVNNLSQTTSNMNRFGLLYRPKAPKTNATQQPIYQGRSPFAKP